MNVANCQTPEHAGEVPQDDSWELPGYTHGRELGIGATGRVVLAQHDSTGVPVAIKYLNGPSVNYEHLRAEAGMLGTIDSPHVARFYEYVEGPLGGAIVMELVDGISLRDLLHVEGATKPEAALTVLKGSLLGLAAAHATGLVHRDYKPGNVLVTPDGTSKLVDFGIAVPSGYTGFIAGTPPYMAPEQWAGATASPSTDVYAATVTFFECLTGAKPYAGSTLKELAVAHCEARIPEEQAPEALRSLIRAGLAKTPEGRPTDALSFIAELEAVAGTTYGRDWEERGRGQLAALLALLALLLPYGSGQETGTTSLATTELGGSRKAGAAGEPVGPGGGSRSRWRPRTIGTAAAGAVLIGGALVGLSTLGTSQSNNATTSAHSKLTARPGSTFSEIPATNSGLPSRSGSGVPVSAASDLPSAVPPVSASEPSSALPSYSSSAQPAPGPTTDGTPKPSMAPTGRGGAPTTAASPSPSHAPLHVHTISMTVGCDQRYAAKAEGTVTTDGAAIGTLTVTWTDNTGRQVASNSLTLPHGQTSIPFAFSQPFNFSESLTARAATSPAAASGQNASDSRFSFLCDPPR
ncbi:protein kinase [Streptomyces sp. NPDC005574]|uniref:serine/threonine-protein kinase n=1 Tax=Streptomyces sp. NPDC005574 TaxID=3156891 RepID=UPI0033BBB611